MDRANWLSQHELNRKLKGWSISEKIKPVYMKLRNEKLKCLIRTYIVVAKVHDNLYQTCFKNDVLRRT